MDEKLTPWFPGHVKPTRPGVYERNFHAGARYAMWTGVQWLISRHTLKRAAEARTVSAIQEAAWRGLAENPAGVDEQRGLYEKFHVVRTDGTSALGGKHHNCDYFVLDTTHDKHAAAALAVCADSVEATHPQLAADMRARWKLNRKSKRTPR